MFKRIKIDNTNIYLPPVEEAVRKISEASENVFLLGGPGSGKSTVLQVYENSESLDNVIINGTVGSIEYLRINDRKVFNLYHTCLIVLKMCKYIEMNFIHIFLENFLFFEKCVKNILNKTKELADSTNYNAKIEYLEEDLLEHPEILLEDFLAMTLKYLGYQNLTVIIDQFDARGDSSRYYQTFIYELLSKKVKLITTVSDLEYTHYSESRERLQQIGTVVKVDYSCDVEVVTEILDYKILESYLFKGNEIFQKRPRFILSKDTIKRCIEMTDGNLTKMYSAVSELYRVLHRLVPEQYERYVLNCLEQEQFTKWNRVPQRKLYI